MSFKRRYLSLGQDFFGAWSQLLQENSVILLLQWLVHLRVLRVP